MTAPIEHLIKWYEDLPVSHRQDIAALLSHSVPGFSTLDITNLEAMTTDFVALIRSHMHAPMAEACLTLALREAMELLIIRPRSSRAGWADTQAKADYLSYKHDSPAFEAMAQQIEFRAEQWIRSCEQWQRMRDEYLTNGEIQNHLDRAKAFGRA